MIRSIWNKIFTNTFNASQDAAMTNWDDQRSFSVDKRVIIVLITTAVSLMLIEYFGSARNSAYALRNIGLDSLGDYIMERVNDSPDGRLFQLKFWALFTVGAYFVIPALVIKLLLKDSIRNYGFRMGNAIKDYQVYLVFFGFMLPLIFAVSHTSSFQHKYPFYDLAQSESLWPNFWIWQCFYLLQFFGLEFFFRGFIVHGTKHRFGFYSVFIMMVPYCMIHFQKPFLETTGAIFAGIVLGALSLKSRSIWLGVAIHYSVAITMDIMALWQKGYF